MYAFDLFTYVFRRVAQICPTRSFGYYTSCEVYVAQDTSERILRVKLHIVSLIAIATTETLLDNLVLRLRMPYTEIYLFLEVIIDLLR